MEIHVLPFTTAEVGEAEADQDLRAFKTLALELQRRDRQWSVDYVVLDDYTTFLHLVDGGGRQCEVLPGCCYLGVNVEEDAEEYYEVPSIFEAVRLLVSYGAGLSLSGFSRWRYD